MTIAQADTIRHLLNLRDGLKRELKDLVRCDSICGHINEGSNGLGFGWQKGSRQIQYLIEGTEREIADIEKTISSIEMKGAE